MRSFSSTRWRLGAVHNPLCSSLYAELTLSTVQEFLFTGCPVRHPRCKSSIFTRCWGCCTSSSLTHVHTFGSGISLHSCLRQGCETISVLQSLITSASRTQGWFFWGILLNLSHIHLNSALALFHISLLQVCSARHPPLELRKQREREGGAAALGQHLCLPYSSNPHHSPLRLVIFSLLGVKTLRFSEVK